MSEANTAQNITETTTEQHEKDNVIVPEGGSPVVSEENQGSENQNNDNVSNLDQDSQNTEDTNTVGNAGNQQDQKIGTKTEEQKDTGKPNNEDAILNSENQTIQNNTDVKASNGYVANNNDKNNSNMNNDNIVNDKDKTSNNDIAEDDLLMHENIVKKAKEEELKENSMKFKKQQEQQLQEQVDNSSLNAGGLEDIIRDRINQLRLQEIEERQAELRQRRVEAMESRLNRKKREIDDKYAEEEEDANTHLKIGIGIFVVAAVILAIVAPYAIPLAFELCLGIPIAEKIALNKKKQEEMEKYRNDLQGVYKGDSVLGNYLKNWTNPYGKEIDNLQKQLDACKNCKDGKIAPKQFVDEIKKLNPELKSKMDTLEKVMDKMKDKMKGTTLTEEQAKKVAGSKNFKEMMSNLGDKVPNDVKNAIADEIVKDNNEKIKKLEEKKELKDEEKKELEILKNENKEIESWKKEEEEKEKNNNIEKNGTVDQNANKQVIANEGEQINGENKDTVSKNDNQDENVVKGDNSFNKENGQESDNKDLQNNIDVLNSEEKKTDDINIASGAETSLNNKHPQENNNNISNVEEDKDNSLNSASNIGDKDTQSETVSAENQTSINTNNSFDTTKLENKINDSVGGVSNQVSSVENKLDAIMDQINMQKELDTQIKSLEDKQNQNAEWEKHLQEQQEEQQSKEKELGEKESKLQKQQEYIKQEQENIKSTKAEYSKKINDMNALKAQLEQEKQELKLKQTSLESIINQKQEEKIQADKNLTDKNNSLQGENTELKGNLETLKKQLEDLKNKNNLTDAEKAKLKAELKAQIEKLQNDGKVKDKKIGDLTKENENQQKAIKEQNSKMSEQQNTINDQEAEINKLKEQLASMKKSYETQMTNMQQKHETQMSKFSKYANQIKEQEKKSLAEDYILLYNVLHPGKKEQKKLSDLSGMTVKELESGIDKMAGKAQQAVNNLYMANTNIKTTFETDISSLPTQAKVDVIKQLSNLHKSKKSLMGDVIPNVIAKAKKSAEILKTLKQSKILDSGNEKPLETFGIKVNNYLNEQDKGKTSTMKLGNFAHNTGGATTQNIPSSIPNNKENGLLA